jgi:hypothetical protein
MASLSDILTTQKNGVVAINNIAQTFLRYIGTNTTPALSTASVIVVGAGRLVNLSIVTAGTASGTVYNASSYDPLNPPPDSQKLYTLTTTAGVYNLNLVFSQGLVFVPGTGQRVALTYSVG